MKKSLDFGFGLSELNNNANNGGVAMFKKLVLVLMFAMVSMFGCFNEQGDEPCNNNCEADEVCVADECETACTTNNDCFATHGGGWICKVVAGVGGYCAVQSSDDDAGVPDNGVPACQAKTEVCDGVDNDCDDKVDEGVKNACGQCGALPKEVCDAKDNDCDGNTDENVTNACGDCGPVPAEVCDGKDNDCNDQIPLVENDEDSDGFRVCEGDCNDQNIFAYPGALELCNGLDDDCDGFANADEADADIDGYRVCDLDCDDADDARFPGSVELCDGVDEDCDGDTDENFYVGVPCLSLGACGWGVFECKNLFGYQCSTMPGASADASVEEVCGDNIDNDCNGVVDDPPCQCEPGSFLVCGTSTEGQCKQGLQECVDGKWGPCVGAVEPLPEMCNGKDDDCDGVTPVEELDVDNDGFSMCGGDCADDTFMRSPAVKEVCNGVDDDCDGPADEDFAVGVKCTGLGFCGMFPGVYECDGPNGSTCSTMPGMSADKSSPEVCSDNIDNDCNGAVDEVCGCDFNQDKSKNEMISCGLNNLGQCKYGVMVCQLNGNYGECIGAKLPEAELCNGLDDDCDDVVLFLESDMDGDGFRICEGDCNDAVDTVNPGWVEVCNGVDDDCDESIDEDYFVNAPCNGEGACGLGTIECASLSNVICSTEPNGSADESVLELCSDSLDNDCDGSVDEDCTCKFVPGVESFVKCGVSNVGVCLFGKQICQPDGNLGDCEGAKLPEAEKCDGKDNDCDDVLPANEADADGDGFRVCESDCNDLDPAVNPAAKEICNGVDDDCDGPVDEDFFVGGPCNGEGACGWGKIECAGLSKTVCSTEPGGSASEAAPDVCGDLLDNDCDGKVDEDCSCKPGQKEPCGTNDNFPCKFGVRVCNADGTWGACVGNKEPEPETCDGLDTDCDEQLGVGEVDADGDGQMICQGDCDDGIFDRNSGVPEVCDGVDNDCDGVADDGFGVGVKCEGKGACGKGVLECNAALDSQCSTMPGGSKNGATPEKGGDFIDNDCDGSVDEWFACVFNADKLKNQYLFCGTSGVLPCKYGNQTCQPNFQWGPCVGAIDPVLEQCNGIDDDCDGLITFVAGLAEADKDKDGQMECDGDCNDSDATVNTMAKEKCNGIDDDCDGDIDEDFLVGASCEGKGACGEGVRECAGDFLWVCSTMPGGSKNAATAEACTDFVDNDCDGLVNEVCDCLAGMKQPCGSSSVQPCQKGEQVCGVDGKWGACVGNKEPELEKCDGIDNDCDGKLGVDEVDVDGDGEMKCAGDCNDASPFINTNATELCNGGVDDDCDGAKDEGYNLGVPCNAFGACGAGVFECAGTLGYQCSTAPGGSKDASKPEVCSDFVDNDCDNSVDEGCVCLPGTLKECGTSDVLPCQKGKQLCDPDGKKWGVCGGAIEPKPEECNGLDDNCDGALGATEVDVDKDGEMICDGDCNDANAKINTGAKEVCDGADNNCDSAKDEGFFVGAPCFGMGACGDGKIECNAFGIAQCSTLPNGSENKAKPEACNDLIDNDCDGVTDEDCKCVFNADDKLNPQLTCGTTDVGECGYGVQKCLVTGQWGLCVGNVEPVAEKCNGLDDDCNGLVPANEADADKDGYRVCENDCSDINSNINPGEVETCNGIDDNCDKVKDEGCAFVSCNVCCGFGLGHPVVFWGGDPVSTWNGDGYCDVWTGTVQQICLRGTYPVQGYVNAGWVDSSCQNGNSWSGLPAGGVLWCVDQAGKAVNFAVVPGVVDPQGEGEIILLDGLCKP